jgi:hypothetical protein
MLVDAKMNPFGPNIRLAPAPLSSSIEQLVKSGDMAMTPLAHSSLSFSNDRVMIVLKRSWVAGAVCITAHTPEFSTASNAFHGCVHSAVIHG